MSTMVKPRLAQARIAFAVVFCLALAAALCGCSQQQAPSDAGSSVASSSQAAAIDTSSWKTLGDALAAADGDISASSWNDEYYVSVFQAGDSIFRVVAKVTPEGAAAMDAVDWNKDNVSEQIEKAAASLELASVDDLTGDLLSQDQLDALAGKTGQDLVDEGWVFESYTMYGGAQTIATFAKGNLAYDITFDGTTPESATEDDGESVMGYQVVEAVFVNAANSATDPTNVSL